MRQAKAKKPRDKKRSGPATKGADTIEKLKISSSDFFLGPPRRAFLSFFLLSSLSSLFSSFFCRSLSLSLSLSLSRKSSGEREGGGERRKKEEKEKREEKTTKRRDEGGLKKKSEEDIFNFFQSYPRLLSQARIAFVSWLPHNFSLFALTV